MAVPVIIGAAVLGGAVRVAAATAAGYAARSAVTAAAPHVMRVGAAAASRFHPQVTALARYGRTLLQNTRVQTGGSARTVTTRPGTTRPGGPSPTTGPGKTFAPTTQPLTTKGPIREPNPNRGPVGPATTKPQPATATKPSKSTKTNRATNAATLTSPALAMRNPVNNPARTGVNLAMAGVLGAGVMGAIPRGGVGAQVNQSDGRSGVHRGWWGGN
jgi:hypothetical protein